MLIVQTAANPATIRHTIADLLTPGVTEICVASAYVTVSGCRLLFDVVIKAVGQKAFDAMPKTLITCFDYGLTAPEALSLWLSQPNASVHVAGAERLMQGSLAPSRAFHPKMYAFIRGKSQEGSLVTGSANLTGRGWSNNTESAWAADVVSKVALDTAFSSVRNGTVPLTGQLHKAYVALRRRQPPAPIIRTEVEPVSEPVLGPETDLPLFRLAIENGDVDPAAASSMWVQGEALQGGSGNQLELPRGAHRFFGYEFTQYDSRNKITIGPVILKSGARVWRDRLLTWHGNNRMERMNLPTVRQGGFEYADTAVMFRRLDGDMIELIVTPWESDLARSWRAASAQRGALFRLGKVATNRTVGFI